MNQPHTLETRDVLTPRQAEGAGFVVAYFNLTGEEPPVRLVAKRLNLSRACAHRLMARARERVNRAKRAR